jgi:hypothetical protein
VLQGESMLLHAGLLGGLFSLFGLDALAITMKIY